MGPLDGKRLAPKEVLPDDLDIRTVLPVDPEDVEHGKFSLPEQEENFENLRHHRPALGHPERSSFKHEVVLHIDDQECGSLHLVTSHKTSGFGYKYYVLLRAIAGSS